MTCNTTTKGSCHYGVTPWENISGYKLFAPHLYNLFFEIYENDLGTLCLCILDDEFEFLCGFAYDPGMKHLKDDLLSLTEDKTGYTDWNFNMLYEGNFTIDDLEEMRKNGGFGDLIADRHGVYFDNLRTRGREALGIPEDMTKKPQQKTGAPALGNTATQQGQENHIPQREANKWQAPTKPAFQKGGTPLTVDPEKNEAAAKVCQMATLIMQRDSKLLYYQRKIIIKEAISLMHTAGIITDEQTEQLKDLMSPAARFSDIDTETELIASVIYEAADNYVMTGTATVTNKAGEDSGGVNLEDLKAAVDIAYRAQESAHKTAELNKAIRREIRKAEQYDDAFIKSGHLRLDEYADSCREAADMKQESLKEELEETKTILDELEPCFVPEIITVQELQYIIDTTTTGTDEVKDMESVATAIYDKIRDMYEAAELELTEDTLRRIFNAAT